GRYEGVHLRTRRQDFIEDVVAVGVRLADLLTDDFVLDGEHLLSIRSGRVVFDDLTRAVQLEQVSRDDSRFAGRTLLSDAFALKDDSFRICHFSYLLIGFLSVRNIA